MLTTTIGSYPKLPFMTLPSFKAKQKEPSKAYSEWLKSRTPEEIELIEKGTKMIVREQCECGIDIPTDGEAPRSSYIYYHLHHLQGIDFENLSTQELRGKTWQADVPTIVGEIRAGDAFLPHDWKIAQSATDKPVKMSVPGPMTIMGTTSNAFYPDEKSLAFALADVLNVEIRRLADAGCRHIQIDEPVFARRPDDAIAWGFEAVERCFHNTPDSLEVTMHMCCGYPRKIDDLDYPKADQQAYFQLAPALDESCVDAVSIEDAHRHNDLTLLEKFKTTKVILGAVHIASSRLEPVEEIRDRLKEALEHIDSDRLIAAPDCGLAMLPHDLAVKKMTNLCEAAHSL